MLRVATPISPVPTGPWLEPTQTHKSPRRPSPPRPVECPEPLTLPISVTTNPSLPLEQQIKHGQSLRTYGPLICVTNWRNGVRHGLEVYALISSDGPLKILARIDWEDGVCKEGLDRFNLDGVNLKHWLKDKPVADQRKGGKTVDLLPNDVLRVCHWINGKRQGPDRHYAVFPQRPPVLVRELWWENGLQNGGEQHWNDTNPHDWSAPPQRELVLWRSWTDGKLDGAEWFQDTPTGRRVERCWVQGSLNGAEVHRYANGRAQLRASWQSGWLHGSWQLFYKNGKLCESGCMVKGKRDGVWCRFNRQGREVRWHTYVNGVQTGPQGQLSDGQWSTQLLDPTERQRRSRAAMEQQLNKLRSQAADPNAAPSGSLQARLERLERKLE